MGGSTVFSAHLPPVRLFLCCDESNIMLHFRRAQSLLTINNVRSILTLILIQTDYKMIKLEPQCTDAMIMPSPTARVNEKKKKSQHQGRHGLFSRRCGGHASPSRLCGGRESDGDYGKERVGARVGGTGKAKPAGSSLNFPNSLISLNFLNWKMYVPNDQTETTLNKNASALFKCAYTVLFVDWETISRQTSGLIVGTCATQPLRESAQACGREGRGAEISWCDQGRDEYAGKGSEILKDCDHVYLILKNDLRPLCNDLIHNDVWTEQCKVMLERGWKHAGLDRAWAGRVVRTENDEGRPCVWSGRVGLGDDIQVGDAWLMVVTMRMIWDTARGGGRLWKNSIKPRAQTGKRKRLTTGTLSHHGLSPTLDDASRRIRGPKEGADLGLLGGSLLFLEQSGSAFGVRKYMLACYAFLHPDQPP